MSNEETIRALVAACRKALEGFVAEHDMYCEEDKCTDKLTNDAREALATLTALEKLQA
jgi:hypothetical protein